MADQGIQVVVREEDGRLWATVEEFPGVFATGDNFEELEESLAEGISLYLAEEGKEPQPIHLAPLRPVRTETHACSELLTA
jgi:predicted RNase H-like HicB family nuclease